MAQEKLVIKLIFLCKVVATDTRQAMEQTVEGGRTHLHSSRVQIQRNTEKVVKALEYKAWRRRRTGEKATVEKIYTLGMFF